MAKNTPDAEDIFRKTEDEMSDIEKMMAEILSETDEKGRRDSSAGAAGKTEAERKAAYASPAPPSRARKVSGSASGSRVEKAVADNRQSAEVSARQSRSQKLEREKNIREASKKRSLAPMIVALVLIALFVVGALVYTKMFEDIRLRREATQTSVSTAVAADEEDTDPEDSSAPVVTFPPDMVFPTPESQADIDAGNVHIVPPSEPLVILSDTRTPEPVSEGEDASPEAETQQTSSETETQKEHTYRFFKEDRSWTDAQQACKDLGGYLAVVRNEQELQKVIALAQQNGIEKVWLGCHRENGQLVWENGETVNFYVWGANEPSLYDNGDKVAEDYLLLWRFNGAWVYNDSRNDPVSDYPGMYRGQIGYVCEFE